MKTLIAFCLLAASLSAQEAKPAASPEVSNYQIVLADTNGKGPSYVLEISPSGKVEVLPLLGHEPAGYRPYTYGEFKNLLEMAMAAPQQREDADRKRIQAMTVDMVQHGVLPDDALRFATRFVKGQSDCTTLTVAPTVH